LGFSRRQALVDVEQRLKGAEHEADRAEVLDSLDALAALSADLTAAIAELPAISQPLLSHIQKVAERSGQFRQMRQQVSEAARRFEISLPRLVDSTAGGEAVQRLMGDLQRVYREAFGAGERGR
jgi:hypothetical protein